MRRTSSRTENPDSLSNRLDPSTFGPWVKQHAVVLAAIVVAFISCLIVPPDDEYVEYLDVRTLMCLFCTMAVITALDNVGFILVLAGRTIHYFRTRRGIITGLVFMTAVAAMFVSNDMALLTFLPLTYLALEATGNVRYLAFAFIMETAAANLGGMILPFGSPQNLFLFSFYEIPTWEFIGVMALPFGISMILILATCLFVPNDPIREVGIRHATIVVRPTVGYLVLFALTIAVVFRIVPVWTGFIVPAVLLFMDRSALVRLDWGLLFTFVAFFIFAGNVARIESVDTWISNGVNDNVLLWSTLGSQVISNVPTSILFAQFTDAYRELLVGVNIGGVGTIVASLANLIALAKYREYQPGRTKSFLLLFSAVNLGLLLVLLTVMSAAFATDLL